MANRHTKGSQDPFICIFLDWTLTKRGTALDGRWKAAISIKTFHPGHSRRDPLLAVMGNNSILIVDDDPEMRSILSEGLSKNGYPIFLAADAKEALRVFEEKSIDLVLADLKLPGQSGIDLLKIIKKKSWRTPVLLITGYGSVQSAVEAMRSGAHDYILKPFSLATLEESVKRALNPLQQQEDSSYRLPGSSKFSIPILTQNRRMKEILEICHRVAPSKATVLVQGESGTGKELISRYIHSKSPRSQGPFVAVNCASLPETLLESELFGHEKGAFTGAIQKKIGKFELAHGGTILLDEISEMNPLLQAKLLRVLQEGEIDRIGGRHPIPIDVRVIATTNRNIEEAIVKGGFREDLYFRLNVISLRLPPLRERPEDIELLTFFFLRTFAEEYQRPVPSISSEAMAWLKEQPWRGNIRELKNRIERAVLMSSGSTLDLRHLFPEGETGPSEEGPAKTELHFPSLSLKEMEEKMIRRALEKTNGNRTHAAKMLGISIRTLRNKLNEYKQGFSNPGKGAE